MYNFIIYNNSFRIICNFNINKKHLKKCIDALKSLRSLFATAHGWGISLTLHSEVQNQHKLLILLLDITIPIYHKHP